MMLGQTRGQLALTACPSVAQLSARVAGFAGSPFAAACMVGYGWDHELMGALPSRHDIDGHVADRPVVLMRACSHIAVVNTAALVAAGLLGADGSVRAVPGDADARAAAKLHMCACVCADCAR